MSSPYTSGFTYFDDYMSFGTTDFDGYWYSSSGVSSGNFDLDLGGIFSIESLAFWNDGQSVGQGVAKFNLFADTRSDFSSAVLLGNFNATDGGNNGQIFQFLSTQASFVRLEIISNHGSSSWTSIKELII